MPAHQIHKKTAEQSLKETPAGHEPKIARDITRPTLPVAPCEPLSLVRDIFESNAELSSLPVIEEGRIAGMVHRAQIFERRGLRTTTAVGKLCDTSLCTVVRANEELEAVARLAATRTGLARQSDLVVAENEHYIGTISVADLLSALTIKVNKLESGFNSLTQLPGQQAIQREVERRLNQQEAFEACYIDLDNLQLYNRSYGFARGDEAIRVLAQAIQEALKKFKQSSKAIFVGHLHGDEFVILCASETAQEICEGVVREFEAARTTLHEAQDIEQGFYYALNRCRDQETLPLLSVSIGIVSTAIKSFSSFVELSATAAEVKKVAKRHPRSMIVRDRRRE